MRSPANAYNVNPLLAHFYSADLLSHIYLPLLAHLINCSTDFSAPLAAAGQDAGSISHAACWGGDRREGWVAALARGAGARGAEGGGARVRVAGCMEAEVDGFFSIVGLV